ncbi:hypothetical protein ABH978_002623 [Bradyrhizobium ottawaense]
MGATDELVGAIAAPADLLAQLGCGVSDDAVLGIEVGLLAKAAADVADQHAHAVLGTLQHGLGEHVAGRGRGLRLHVQQQAAGLLVDLGNGRARLHRGRHEALADEVELDGVRRLGKRLVHLGGIAVSHRADDVVGRLRPHHGRARFHGLDGVDHRRLHVVLDDDCLCRALRLDAGRRHDGRHGLAGVADDLMGEQSARRHCHRLAVGALEDAQRRDAADIVLDEVGAGVDRGHARHRGGCTGVDRDDLGVGMRRAQDVEPQGAVARLVVDELPLPGQQPLVFQTLDGLPRSETQIAGKNVHSVGSLRSFRNCGQPFSGSIKGIPAAVLGGISADSACCPATRESVGWAKAHLRRAHDLLDVEKSRGHASAFALRATADKSLCPPYGSYASSRSAASTTWRASAVSAACGGTGSPTS